MSRPRQMAPAIPPITPPATTPACEVESWLLVSASGLESPLLLAPAVVNEPAAEDDAVDEASELDPAPDVAVLDTVAPDTVVGLTAAETVPVVVLWEPLLDEVAVAVLEEATALVLGLVLWSEFSWQTSSLLHE